MKKIFSILLTLIFVFALVSCETPCLNHYDNDGDTLCDACGETIQGSVIKPDEAEYDIKITSVNLPASIRKWEANKAEQTNKKTEFYDREQEYVVGDDNEFFVKPVVSFVKVNKETGATLPAIVKDWNFIITVFVKNEEGEYVKLEAENEYVESIDNATCGINFTEKAIGHNFQVEVYPDKLSEEQLASVEKYTKSVKFRVIEGYNAYTSLDLAYIENRNDNTDAAKAWKAFKEEKGLDLELNPGNIIMHGDIEVKEQDLPSYFFYTADEVSTLDSDYHRVIGSMKDYEDMYHRVIGENEEFRLIGNYFKLDCSSLSVIVRENGKITAEGTAISHSQLFKFKGSEKGTGRFENLRVVGNAGRTENALLSGGLILIKVQNVDVTAYNNISVNTFIHYFADRSDTLPNTTSFIVEKCKGYDAFNCFVYNWGSEIYIKDSELIGAGGPVIIQDHTRPTDPENQSIPYTEVLNSKLESFVTGSEGWFKLVNADALVPQIKQMSAIFNMVGKTYVVSDGKTGADALTYLNLICVNKSGDAQSITAQKVSGTLKIDEAVFDYGEKSNPYLAAMLENTYKNNAPAFQTSASTLESGYAYFNGTALMDIQNQPIQDPTNAIFQGEEMCLYYNGMAVVLGFYPADYIYTAE